MDPARRPSRHPQVLTQNENLTQSHSPHGEDETAAKFVYARRSSLPPKPAHHTRVRTESLTENSGEFLPIPHSLREHTRALAHPRTGSTCPGKGMHQRRRGMSILHAQNSFRFAERHQQPALLYKLGRPE